VFHLGEDEHQRVLDRPVQLGHPLRLHAGRDRISERGDGKGIAGGQFGVPERRSVEVELTGARSIVRWPREPRVLLDEVGQRVARLGGIDQVRGDRRVERQATHLDVELEQ
jgi:hypothetical protein